MPESKRLSREQKLERWESRWRDEKFGGVNEGSEDYMRSWEKIGSEDKLNPTKEEARRALFCKRDDCIPLTCSSTTCSFGRETTELFRSLERLIGYPVEATVIVNFKQNTKCGR